METDLIQKPLNKIRLILNYNAGKQVKIYPLVVFRILFGTMMVISTIRFAALGWINTQYIQPKFHFSYFGFGWLPFPPDWAIYCLFCLLLISSFGILLGFLYRFNTLLFFLSFTYIELFDKTYYLNHYYFVSLIGLLINFLPANQFFSFDVWLKWVPKSEYVSIWCIDIIKFQVGLVYFYAGLAKINYDWLILAMPLKLWLPAHNDMPILGYFMTQPWCAYAFSWIGMLFDISIPFLMLNKILRPWAYVLILIFHSLTGYMFQIGVFPLVMSGAVLIFFSTNFHKIILSFIGARFSDLAEFQTENNLSKTRLINWLLIFYMVFQLIFPWRYLLYNGNLFWTEEGYRFSWRVMLMEKAGTAQFYVKDAKTGKEGEVNNADFLNRHQEKQMAMQPDMILQFAHYLHDFYQEKGMDDPIVRSEVYVTLNGSSNGLLVDPQINLAKVQEGWGQKDWILPFENAQKQPQQQP